MTGKHNKEGKLKAVSRKFIVVGTFKSGFQQMDVRLIYARRHDMKGFLDVVGDFNEISVSLKDVKYAEETKAKIDEVLNPHYRKYRVERWEDRHRSFLSALRLERNVMAFILFFIIYTCCSYCYDYFGSTCQGKGERHRHFEIHGSD